ncbi:MAG: ABC transporter ATP-binding protein [Hyphomicrobiales bacterium]|nr:ABC transporter ATP-binding protein [Hyphomicrobiales bacterium]
MSPSGAAGLDASYLRVDRLTKVYATRDGAVPALDQVAFDERRGEFLSILGPSGCGKSTLLMIAAGLVPPSSGGIAVEGRPVHRPRTDVGIVFQSPVLLEWRTALGNVMLQAEARKLERASAERRARELLASVGLAGFEHKYPHELSGGMRQRVSLCRALIHDPDHLLMDEPFGALDALTRDQLVLDLQALWNQRRMTVLFITHSVAEAVFLSDRVIVMTPRPGRIDRIIDIDLPRPRTLALRESPRFAEYSREILDLFLARGVLRER